MSTNQNRIYLKYKELFCILKLFLSDPIWKSNDLTKNKQQRSQHAFSRLATAVFHLPGFIKLTQFNLNVFLYKTFSQHCVIKRQAGDPSDTLFSCC